MPKRVWPIEIERGIARAQAEGKLRTKQALAKIRDGSLPGLSQPYPDYPDRTFYDALKRVRRRRSGIGGGRTPTLAGLKRQGQPRMPTVEQLRRETVNRDARPSSPPVGVPPRIAAKVRELEAPVASAEKPPSVQPPDPDTLPCPVCRYRVKLGTGRCPGCGELLGLSKPRPCRPPPLPRPRPQLTEQERVTGYRRGGWPY